MVGLSGRNTREKHDGTLSALWAQRNGLRVIYLHVLLLGFVTLGLAVAARQVWGKSAVPGQAWLVVAVLIGEGRTDSGLPDAAVQPKE